MLIYTNPQSTNSISITANPPHIIVYTPLPLVLHTIFGPFYPFPGNEHTGLIARGTATFLT